MNRTGLIAIAIVAIAAIAIVAIIVNDGFGTDEMMEGEGMTDDTPGDYMMEDTGQ